MRTYTLNLAILSIAFCSCTALGQSSPKEDISLYVPYKDLAAVVDPAAKAVLMDRQAFAALLAAAEANAASVESIELGQVTAAEYVGKVDGEKLTLTGTLTVESLSDKPVRVPFNFSGIGLTEVSLDSESAPLGYDDQRKLVLVVSGKGTHYVRITASASLKELSGGGTSFSMALPPATAGTMSLSAPGDLEINANVPVASSLYDKQTDQTTAQLPLGGQQSLTVTLHGNGRLEDQNTILLGESVAKISAPGWIALALLAVLGLVLALLPKIRRSIDGSDSFYAQAFVSFLDQDRVGLILGFVIFFRTGESFLQKMRYPFLRDLSMSMEQYAFAHGTVGLWAGIVATLLGGWLISKHGLGRWIWPFVIAQNVLNLLYCVIAYRGGPIELSVVTALIGAEAFGAGLGTSVFMVYLMRCCRPDYKAAHMAIVTALMSVSFTFAGVASGFLASWLGYTGYFGFTFVATIPGMLLIPFIPHVRSRPAGPATA